MNDLKALASDLRRLKGALVDTTNDTTRKVALVVFTEAIRLSSGTKTAADRRNADYPFARRHGSPLWDASTINVGKGEFRRGWMIDSIPGPLGIVRRGVSNHSEVSEWLETGTPTMFARPLKEILEAKAQESWNRLAPPAYETALRSVFQR